MARRPPVPRPVRFASRIAAAVSAAVLASGLAACRTEIAGGRADGATIFSEVCARCHGPAGIPDPGNIARIGVKPLNSDHVRRELQDADIRRQILEGSSNKQMPSFAGALSDAQIEAVIAHVRLLGK